MRIARSTFYDTPKMGADDTALVEAMHAIKDEFEAYGWRRMQAALRQEGWVVNHKKVRRLMREHGLQPPCRRRFVATTDSDHDQPIFADLTRELVVDGPNQLWVCDLTYVAIAVGFVYVAAILGPSEPPRSCHGISPCWLKHTLTLDRRQKASTR